MIDTGTWTRSVRLTVWVNSMQPQAPEEIGRRAESGRMVVAEGWASAKKTGLLWCFVKVDERAASKARLTFGF